MKTIVFTAEAFGFGPCSKMLAISESLRNIRKIFLGTGVAYDLAKLHSFDEIHCLGDEDKEQILILLNKVDLMINVMNFPLNHLAKLAGCPYFLVDSLLWFWPCVRDGMKEADIYFCQNFFGGNVEKKIREYELSNARVIGPIINENFCRHPLKNQVIINFGGVENPFVEIGVNSNYPFIILKNLLPMLQESFTHILVTGRERVMRMCRALFSENESLKFRMLDQKSMLEELYRSSALFTAPGIQTFYDAADKTPIFCLPPQNHSNVSNLEVLIDHGVVIYYLKWDELYESFNGKTREEKMRLVLKKIKEFEESEDDQKSFRNKVKLFLDNRHTWKSLVEHQKKAVESLGPNGVKTIIERVEEGIMELRASFP